jgi:hypothetical protein
MESVVDIVVEELLISYFHGEISAEQLLDFSLYFGVATEVYATMLALAAL